MTRIAIAMIMFGVSVADAQQAPPQGGEVAVAARRLARGTVLKASDFVVTISRAVADSTRVAAGWITRRVIHQGEVLRPPAVAPAPLVRAGDNVRFVVQQPGLQMAWLGTATTSGELGAPVRVRLGPKRLLLGIVTAAGTVTASDSARIP